jgi:hypothetical protein
VKKLAAAIIIMLLGSIGSVSLAAGPCASKPTGWGSAAIQDACGFHPAQLSYFIKECPYLSPISSLMQGIEKAIGERLPGLKTELPISMDTDTENTVKKAVPHLL